MEPHEKVELTVTNEKQVGDIYIKKVDSVDQNILLEGVEYYLNSTNGYVKVKVNGEWAKRVEGTVKVEDTDNKDSNTTFVYTNNKDEATIFVTDSFVGMSLKPLYPYSNAI